MILVLHSVYTVVDTDVVLFALSECNTGNELQEYIDSLLEEIDG